MQLNGKEIDLEPIKALVEQNRLIEAIQNVMQQSGAGLKQAKEFVDGLRPAESLQNVRYGQDEQGYYCIKNGVRSALTEQEMPTDMLQGIKDVVEQMKQKRSGMNTTEKEVKYTNNGNGWYREQNGVREAIDESELPPDMLERMNTLMKRTGKLEDKSFFRMLMKQETTQMQQPDIDRPEQRYEGVSPELPEEKGGVQPGVVIGIVLLVVLAAAAAHFVGLF